MDTSLERDSCVEKNRLRPMMHRVSTIGTPNVQADVGAVGNYPGRTKPGFVVGALVRVLKRNSTKYASPKGKTATKSGFPNL